jgi:uncharacterized protein (DUF2164 family)
MPKLEIELKKEVRLKIIEDLRSYYWNEKDEELTQLAAGMLLDFILEKIGPYIYNQAIEDSYTYMNEKIEDLLGLEKRIR